MDKIIKKTKDLLKKSPNLPNYQKTYQNFSWQKVEKEVAWFSKGKINAAYNAVDKNALSWRKNKVALYWEGSDGREAKYTFLELSLLSNRFANVLKKLGVEKGDRVFFFLPRIPEFYFGFLGTVKLGAIAGTLFSAFGPNALLDRLGNSQAKVLVTDKELLPRVNQVRSQLSHLEQIILVDGEKRWDFMEERLIKSKEGDFYDLMLDADADFKTRQMDKDDPAFMLYTSGTTGKPKGVIHRHGAILQEHLTAKWILDIREDDVYWCTADPGWVTGIAYGILGSWSNGASSLVYEGRFSPEKWYQLIEEYKVNIWYTAPTAIRMLAAKGKEALKKYNLSSLRYLASVGEPLNPEAIWWGLKAFGLPFHDNWWQTETGGILIANYSCMDIKPGSMGKPFPGIIAAIIDDKGNELKTGMEGNLAIKSPWPSMMKTIWRRPQKYQSYFIKGWYISGDRALKDKDGYFWFIGRADDVIKTAGERVGPFEVESALVEHDDVIEAGVIGKPDQMRGEIIKAFISLRSGVKGSEALKKEIQVFVKKHLAGHAYPREIEFVDKLPKTRSGKIMRRVLKAKEMGLPIGDTSTMEEY
ncbi:acetate--CoA ligase [Candidatus Microgenomates bacterium]|nr:acetate--CoA ligase [Candidatus Microgenomates bacterium]